MSYRQNLDELNDMISSQFEEGPADMDPTFAPGQKNPITQGDKFCVIKITVSGVHGTGVTYVCDWTFENGLRTVQDIRQARLYNEEQADHIISAEKGTSSMIRVNAQMEKVSVTFGPVGPEKHPDQDCWNEWMDSPEFDMESFTRSMKIPSSFIPHNSRELTGHNQCHVETHIRGIALTVTVSYRGHASIADLDHIRTTGVFGFSNVSMVIEGEGIGSFTVFTFTL